MAMCLVSAVGFKGNQTCYAFLLFGVEAGVILKGNQEATTIFWFSISRQTHTGPHRFNSISNFDKDGLDEWMHPFLPQG